MFVALVPGQVHRPLGSPRELAIGHRGSHGRPRKASRWDFAPARCGATRTQVMPRVVLSALHRRSASLRWSTGRHLSLDFPYSVELHGYLLRTSVTSVSRLRRSVRILGRQRGAIGRHEVKWKAWHALICQISRCYSRIPQRGNDDSSKEKFHTARRGTVGSHPSIV